jgi:hypothetical protein
MQILKAEIRVEKVIIATRGPVYINGEVKGLFTDETVSDSLQSVNTKHARDLTYDMYFSGYSKTLKMLDEITHIKEVYYLLENPELDFLPKEVIHRPFDYFEASINRNVMGKGLYLKRMSIYRKGIETIASEKSKILDPLRAMCGVEQCYSVIGNDFLYADDDHFSVFGSEYMANYFKAELF